MTISKRVRSCAFALAAGMTAWAGNWSTPAVLGTNAYSGSVALDAAGNMTGVWYQYTVNGSQVNQIWASSAAFGHPWSSPVDISGTIGVASGNPMVHSTSSGDATAIYTSLTTGVMSVDHPRAGNWSTPASTNGVNQFIVANDSGDQGIAWSTGGARATSSTINAVTRPVGGAWSSAKTVASGVHLAFDGATVTPDGAMAVAWESYDAVCGSRACKTSNWVLHVSTHAPGAANWADSGPLLGPDATEHFGQLASDGLNDLAVITLSGGNLVSLVRHGSIWSAPAVVASTSAVSFYTGTGRDNRVFHSDINGHATLVSWSPGLNSLVAVDGSLISNAWGKVYTISGPDQSPGYFDFAMSSTGAAIAFWSISPVTGGNTIWRAATRSAAGAAWNPPATVGTSFQGAGVPEGVAINDAGQAAVVYHGYSSDYLTYIEYSNTYQP